MTAHFLEFLALALAITGFIAVLAEIVTKDPAIIGAILRDSREFAEDKARTNRSARALFGHEAGPTGVGKPV